MGPIYLVLNRSLRGAMVRVLPWITSWLDRRWWRRRTLGRQDGDTGLVRVLGNGHGGRSLFHQAAIIGSAGGIDGEGADFVIGMAGLVTFAVHAIAEVPADSVARRHVAKAVERHCLVLLRQQRYDRDGKAAGTARVIDDGESHAGGCSLVKLIGDDHGDQVVAWLGEGVRRF